MKIRKNHLPFFRRAFGEVLEKGVGKKATGSVSRRQKIALYMNRRRWVEERRECVKGRVLYHNTTEEGNKISSAVRSVGDFQESGQALLIVIAN